MDPVSVPEVTLVITVNCASQVATAQTVMAFAIVVPALATVARPEMAHVLAPEASLGITANCAFLGSTAPVALSAKIAEAENATTVQVCHLFYLLSSIPVVCSLFFSFFSFFLTFVCSQETMVVACVICIGSMDLEESAASVTLATLALPVPPVLLDLRGSTVPPVSREPTPTASPTSLAQTTAPITPWPHAITKPELASAPTATKPIPIATR